MEIKDNTITHYNYTAVIQYNNININKLII